MSDEEKIVVDEFMCGMGMYVDKRSNDINKCRVVLKECEEYFDERADADGDPTGTFIGNQEMALLVLVRRVLQEIE
jgi:hypothetical protein